MTTKTEARYMIVHAGTRKPCRRSLWSENTVLQGLYNLIHRYPDADFLICTEKGVPVPASRLKP